jgi:hypothetical protein
MKSSKMLMYAVVVAVMFALGAPVFAASGNTSSLAFSASGSERTTSAAVAAGSLATALPANVSRVNGYILNTSTCYLRCAFETTSSTGTTQQAIDAHYFYLFPTGDTYGRDRISLLQNNVVYIGAIYYYGVRTDLSTKDYGTATAYEWK